MVSIGPTLPWKGSLSATLNGFDFRIIQTTIGERHGPTFPPKVIPEKVDLDTVVFHANLSINLSNGKVFWKNILQNTLYASAKYSILNPELKIIVVVHIGKGKGADLDNVIQMTETLVIPNEVELVFENSAGQGHELGYNWAELKYLFDHLPLKIGFCLDTQHAFASGLCQWQTKDEIKTFFRRLEQEIPDRLTVIHLNDSGTPFNSHVDRHGNTNLSKGLIWADYPEAFKYLIRIIEKNNIPAVLETADPIGDLVYIL